MRLFRPMLARYDLTEQQWRALRALAAETSPLTLGDVAERTLLLGPSLSRIAAKLEDRGLIDRNTAEDDQRLGLIALSNSGRALVDEVAPHSEATYNRIEEAFGSKRLQRLLVELNELAAIVQTVEVASPPARSDDQ